MSALYSWVAWTQQKPIKFMADSSIIAAINTPIGIPIFSAFRNASESYRSSLVFKPIFTLFESLQITLVLEEDNSESELCASIVHSIRVSVTWLLRITTCEFLYLTCTSCILWTPSEFLGWLYGMAVINNWKNREKVTGVKKVEAVKDKGQKKERKKNEQ